MKARDHPFTVPVGDLLAIDSKLNKRQELAKEVYQKEKAEGKSDAEALQVCREATSIHDEVEEQIEKKVEPNATTRRKTNLTKNICYFYKNKLI